MPRPASRRVERRRQGYGRRKGDLWSSVAKLAGLIASVTGAVLGQAELIGEPGRHYVTVVCIGATAAFGFLMGPQHLQRLLAMFKKRR